MTRILTKEQWDEETDAKTQRWSLLIDEMLYNPALFTIPINTVDPEGTTPYATLVRQ